MFFFFFYQIVSFLMLKSQEFSFVFLWQGWGGDIGGTLILLTYTYILLTSFNRCYPSSCISSSALASSSALPVEMHLVLDTGHQEEGLLPLDAEQ